MTTIKQLQVLPTNIRRMIYSYDSTYRIKYRYVMKELLFKKDPKYYIRRFDYVLQHMRRLLAFDVPNYETLIVKKESSFIESEKYYIDKHQYYNHRRVLRTYGVTWSGYIPQTLTLRYTTIVKYFELTYNTLYHDSWDEDDTDYEDDEDEDDEDDD